MKTAVTINVDKLVTALQIVQVNGYKEVVLSLTDMGDGHSKFLLTDGSTPLCCFYTQVVK